MHYSNVYAIIILGGDYMEQRNRPGGNDGLGYFTSWDKSKAKGCIYCGKPATTREHVPSKAFLTEPYPENLATIPACFECNNGFSNDEEYVSCFLDILKEAVYQGYARRTETTRRLERHDKLQALLNEQIKFVDGEIHYNLDGDRLWRILIKLAKGHAGFEFDYINFDDSDPKVNCNFVFNMSEDDINKFEEIPEMNLFPEVGSRSCTTPFIVQNIATGKSSAYMFWNDVQENQYRYQVSYNASGGICVKIVIYEMLYCRVDFD